MGGIRPEEALDWRRGLEERLAYIACVLHASVGMADCSRAPVARALVQQCLHARLQVKPPEAGSEAEWVEVTSALAVWWRNRFYFH